MSIEIDGTLTRQVLPWPLPQKATAAELRKLYRYVTWVTEAISHELAQAHLNCGGPTACVVMVFRGPKGGWTDAQYVPAGTLVPKPRIRRTTVDGVTREVKRTLYYGWVHSPGLPHPRDIMMPRPQWRATLELHA